MILTFLATLLGLACAWFRRGRGEAERIKLLWWPLLLVALLCRLVVAVTDGNLAVFAEVSMLTALLWFCLRNVTLTGLSIVALGITANLVVLAVNEGTPVRPSAAVSAGLIDEDQLSTSDFSGPRHLETAEDRLGFLGDILPIGMTRQVLSFGDLILLAGLGNVVFAAAKVLFARNEAEEVSRAHVLAPEEPEEEVNEFSDRWSRTSSNGDEPRTTESDGSKVLAVGHADEADHPGQGEDQIIDIDELEQHRVPELAGSAGGSAHLDAAAGAATAAAWASGADEADDHEDDETGDEIDLRTAPVGDGWVNSEEPPDSAPTVDPEIAAAFQYDDHQATIRLQRVDTKAPVIDEPGGASAGAATTPDAATSSYQVRVVESATIAAAFKWDEPATDLELINASDFETKDRRDGPGAPTEPAVRGDAGGTSSISTGELPRGDAAEEARLDVAFGPLSAETDANVVPLMANEGRPPMIVRAPKAGGMTPVEPSDVFEGVDVVVIKATASPAPPKQAAPDAPAIEGGRHDSSGSGANVIDLRDAWATSPRSPLSEQAALDPVIAKHRKQDGVLDISEGPHQAGAVLDLTGTTVEDQIPPAITISDESTTPVVIDLDQDPSADDDASATTASPDIRPIEDDSATPQMDAASNVASRRGPLDRRDSARLPRRDIGRPSSDRRTLGSGASNGPSFSPPPSAR